jgi:hypothetical protein
LGVVATVALGLALVVDPGLAFVMAARPVVVLTLVAPLSSSSTWSLSAFPTCPWSSEWVSVGSGVGSSLGEIVAGAGAVDGWFELEANAFTPSANTSATAPSTAMILMEFFMALSPIRLCDQR